MEKQLTDNQIEFLLEFFLEGEKKSGYDSIAFNLIKKGQCVVAGDGRIWIGGIGNFIKVTPAENTVGCSLLEFDVKSFINSCFFKGHLIASLISNKQKLEDARLRYCELKEFEFNGQYN